MSKRFKHISIVFLLLIYFLALSISNIYGVQAGLVSNSADNHSKSVYFSNSKFTLQLHTIKNKKYGSNFNKLTGSNEKRLHADLLNCIPSKDFYCISRYSNYLLIEKFTFVFFKSTDIIYPFHYFW